MMLERSAKNSAFNPASLYGPAFALGSWAFVWWSKVLYFPIKISVEDDSSILTSGLIEGISMLIVLTVVIAAKTRILRRSASFWLAIAGASLLMFFCLLATYVYLISNLTCPYYKGLRLILGGVGINECAKVTAAAGLTREIWDSNVLTNRYYAVLASYVFTWAFLSISLSALANVRGFGRSKG